MNIKKLTASDFPGIDEAKFNEWKALGRKADRDYYIAAFIFLAIVFILWLLTGFESPSIIVLVFFLALIGFYSIRSKRLRQLGKELKMSDRLWAKKKGRVFTG